MSNSDNNLNDSDSRDGDSDSDLNNSDLNNNDDSDVINVEAEPESSSEPAVPLSADELSRAFAQLMGDEDSEQDDSEQEAATTEADESDVLTDATRTDSDSTASSSADHDDSPVSPESILEAMLFVGHPNNEPLSNRVLASLMRGVSPKEIDEMVVELNDQYEQQQTAYEIVAEGGGYRMALRESLAFVRNQFYGKVKEAKLSQSAIDVLAIVAYNEPAERKQVEQTFGKPAGGLLRQLVRRNLLSLEKTSEKPRKTIYRTTDRFLQFFGLDSLDDLPRGDDF